MRTAYAYSRIIVEQGLPVDFIHLEVNGSYERLTGLKNVVGRKISAVFKGINASNPELIAKLVTVAESGIPDYFELYIKTLDRWFDISVYSPQEGDCVALFDDITLRKNTEKALLKSEERFRHLFEGHCAPMLVIDAFTGNIIDANMAATAFYGWSKSELCRMNIEEINALPPEAVALNLEKFRVNTENKFLFSHRKADGSVCSVEVLSNTIKDNGNTLYYSMISDVTERLKNEEAIRASEERFRMLFEKHSAVMILLDPQTGNIIDANLAAAKFYGWSTEELRQMRIQEITNVSADEVKINMEKSRTSEQNRFLFTHKRADASLRKVEVFSNTIKIDGKELLYAIIHDITLRVNTEEALKKSEKQLDKQYQTLIAASPDSIITTNLVGMISSVSDVGLEIFGANHKSEVIGMPFSMIVFEDDMKIIDEIFEVTLREGLIQNREILLKKINQTVYYAEISAALIQESNGIPSSFMIIIRDISQRKVIERELSMPSAS